MNGSNGIIVTYKMTDDWSWNEKGYHSYQYNYCETPSTFSTFPADRQRLILSHALSKISDTTLEVLKELSAEQASLQPTQQGTCIHSFKTLQTHTESVQKYHELLKKAKSIFEQLTVQSHVLRLEIALLPKNEMRDSLIHIFQEQISSLLEFTASSTLENSDWDYNYYLKVSTDFDNPLPGYETGVLNDAMHKINLKAAELICTMPSESNIRSLSTDSYCTLKYALEPTLHYLAAQHRVLQLELARLPDDDRKAGISAQFQEQSQSFQCSYNTFKIRKNDALTFMNAQQLI